MLNIGRGHLGNVYHTPVNIGRGHRGNVYHTPVNIGRGHRGNVYHTPVTFMFLTHTSSKGKQHFT